MMTPEQIDIMVKATSVQQYLYGRWHQYKIDHKLSSEFDDEFEYLARGFYLLFPNKETVNEDFETIIDCFKNPEERL